MRQAPTVIPLQAADGRARRSGRLHGALAKGSPLDLASYDPAGGSNLVTKMGIDATRQSNYPDEISVPGVEAINMAEYIPGYGR